MMPHVLLNTLKDMAAIGLPTALSVLPHAPPMFDDAGPHSPKPPKKSRLLLGAFGGWRIHLTITVAKASPKASE